MDAEGRRWDSPWKEGQFQARLDDLKRVTNPRAGERAAAKEKSQNGAQKPGETWTVVSSKGGNGHGLGEILHTQGSFSCPSHTHLGKECLMSHWPNSAPCSGDRAHILPHPRPTTEQDGVCWPRSLASEVGREPGPGYSKYSIPLGHASSSCMGLRVNPAKRKKLVSRQKHDISQLLRRATMLSGPN